MKDLPRNMPLRAFDPHRKDFSCSYEAQAEPPVDPQAERWFLEGLAATSNDLWPDEKNYENAADLWKRAAEKKYWKAMLNLASLYAYGLGINQDTEQAVQLVEEVMRMGIPKAFDLMGSYHMDGIGVEQNPTRAYAFWALAADMGNADSQAYLGEKLDAAYDDSKGAFWSNVDVAKKMLQCAIAQSNGAAALQVGATLSVLSDSRGEIDGRAITLLHDGVKWGSRLSAVLLFAAFDSGENPAQLRDRDRAERYQAINNLLRLNPDLRLPNLDKVLPLPPAVLPYWDGEKQTLIDGAKPVKAVSPDDIKPSPASLRQGRAHIPDGFVLPDEPQGGHLIQHLHTDTIISGFWLAQLAKPFTPKQVEWNAAQVPMYYALGESFTLPADITKESGVLRFHYLGTPVAKPLAAQHVPDWRVPQGVLREIPVPSRELRSSGLLPAPATGIWHGEVDPSHPLAKVFNQWTRQAYVEEGQSFPDPRDRGLDISPKDIQWQWLDQANQPLPSGRKDITIRNFDPADTTKDQH
ncbi:SEL1 repeat domain-containing protein [Herbaspirillum rubrisubalbicans M1]|nr:SEL1 repeat domain-containing protein [Herbaspirillum rubrisubalbicans M1]